MILGKISAPRKSAAFCVPGGVLCGESKEFYFILTNSAVLTSCNMRSRRYS